AAIRTDDCNRSASGGFRGRAVRHCGGSTRLAGQARCLGPALRAKTKVRPEKGDQRDDGGEGGADPRWCAGGGVGVTVQRAADGAEFRRARLALARKRGATRRTTANCATIPRVGRAFSRRTPQTSTRRFV